MPVAQNLRAAKNRDVRNTESNEMPSPKPIDLAYNLDPTTPVYPNYPPVAVQVLESTRYTRTDGRRSLNSTKITLGLHCATHMDAPFHFFENEMSIDQVPLDVCVGKALMIDVRNALEGSLIGVHHLEPQEAKIREIRRIVIHSGWSSKWGTPEFFSGHPMLTPEAAQILVDCGVRLVAVDFPAIDRAPYPVHITFLSRGIIIVENLTNLAALKKDVFDLIVLPLKFTGRDGSPVRAIALEE
jgi:arylformamidase